jgi:hypothetical protein
VIERAVSGHEVALPIAGFRLGKREIGCTVDADDARHLLGFGCIDTNDASVGVRAQHQSNMEKSGDAQITRESSLSGHLLGAINARDRLPDDGVLWHA